MTSLVRGNIGGARPGLVVAPLFAGYDEDTAGAGSSATPWTAVSARRIVWPPWGRSWLPR
jgi:hypothetical protein